MREALFDPYRRHAAARSESCTGRVTQKRTHDDVAFRVLVGDQHPDHDLIASFRQEHLASLGGLFAQVLVLCQKAGLQGGAGVGEFSREKMLPLTRAGRDTVVVHPGERDAAPARIDIGKVIATIRHTRS